MKLPLSLTLGAILCASSILPATAQASSTAPHSREATFRLTSSHYHHHHYRHHRHAHRVHVWVRGHLVWSHGHRHWVPSHSEWRLVYY
jgi:hypothetical protein